MTIFFINASTLRISQHMCGKIMIQMSPFLSRSFAAHIGKPLVRLSLVNKKRGKRGNSITNHCKASSSHKGLVCRSISAWLSFLSRL